jgi:lipopolysaccharide/colanic/teichoic acid biosynthesis glycosyltransferase
VGLGSFDTDAGAQPSETHLRAPYMSGSLTGGAEVVVASSAAELRAPAYETHALIAPTETTDSARLLTPPTALGDYARNAATARSTTRRESGYEEFVKPVIDRFLAFVLLIVFVPLLLVVAVMVAISLGWPLVLRQRRVGRNGETFVLHKFRTMQPDRRRARLAFEGADRRRTHKHPDDPRLTSVGRTLRKWSLDEMPQLWDVLTGKLSLVGPRPELESIVANYQPWQHARHAVKPGLTGLWQVKARGDGEMHEHTDLDIEYVQSVTLRNDLKITLLTIPAILARKGY